MATTTNFGWETPDDTDLVKDGAAAMRTLGNSIDTSFVDLKGGTTGQVLSKASNTDLDYTWVTTDDANAIQNAIVDAKGDLIAATAADTPARLAVGTNGQVLTADSTAPTGLAWTTPSSGVSNAFFAGKNKIINGDFSVWQRGTSFTNNGSTTYNVDRWRQYFDGSGATRVISRQTFTPGAAPVSGYEGTYFCRFNQTVAGTGGTYNTNTHVIENVRTFAGQTVTLSYWAKAAATLSLTIECDQGFGTGGSSTVSTNVVTNQSITTSWVRYSHTFSMPSISGKTVGTSNHVNISFKFPVNTTFTFDYWGVQLEAGSTATDFQTATGTIQGELAACQRYYFRLATPSGSSGVIVSGFGTAVNSTSAQIPITLPVTMRINPTTADYASLRLVDFSNPGSNITSMTVYDSTTTVVMMNPVVASGLTQYRNYSISSQSGADGYLGLSAEV